MHEFTRRFLTEWRKLRLPFEGETFVVAVSGGADSCALWLVINDLLKRKKLTHRFVAAHFNHDLRGKESDADARFVQSIAEDLDFEFVCKKAEVKIGESNIEEKARAARYAFLNETAAMLNAKAVLTAHTVDDQAETFLLNLIRGSGIEGLGAMRQIRKLNREKSSEILLVRPLLNWATRKKTENFCRLKQIEFRRDSMNENLAYNRVRIRKILVPLLEDFNPQIVEKLARTAALLREEFDELETATTEKYGSFKSRDDISELSLSDIRDIFPSMRRRILRRWLKENRGDLRRLSEKHIRAIENLAFSRKSGKIVEIASGERIVKEDGNLIFRRAANNEKS